MIREEYIKQLKEQYRIKEELKQSGDHYHQVTLHIEIIKGMIIFFDDIENPASRKKSYKEKVAELDAL